MKQFIKKIEDFFLVGATLCIMAILAAFFIWGIAFLVEKISIAVANPSAENAVTLFNLDAAAKLDLKGLKN